VQFVLEKLPIAGMAVKSIDKEGAIHAFLNTGAALVTCKVKTRFPLRTGRRREIGIGHQGSKPAATALFRDEPMIHPKSAQACNVGDVAVGPVAHQDLRIIVVGCRDQGGLKTGALQEDL
jgi:hypothetical protein